MFEEGGLGFLRVLRASVVLGVYWSRFFRIVGVYFVYFIFLGVRIVKVEFLIGRLIVNFFFSGSGLLMIKMFFIMSCGVDTGVLSRFLAYMGNLFGE